MDVRRVHGDPDIQGTTVRVLYEPSFFGNAANIRILAGPNATPKHIKDHVRTVRTLKGFQGITGILRRIYRKIMKLPPLHTKGFEAELEKAKLRTIISDRVTALRTGPPLDPAAYKAARKEIAGYRKQLETFEKQLGSIEKGRGFVAAEDPAAKKPGDSATAPQAPPVDPNTALAAQRQHTTRVRTDLAAALGINASELVLVKNAKELKLQPKPHGQTKDKTYVFLTDRTTITQAVDAATAHTAQRVQRMREVAAKTWTGEKEAAFRGWPEPGPDHHWAWDSRKGELSLRRTRVKDSAGKDVSKQRYSQERQRFEDVPDSLTKRTAVRELYGDGSTDFGLWVRTLEALGLSHRNKLQRLLPGNEMTLTSKSALFYLQFGQPKWLDAMVWKITDPKFVRRLPQYGRLKKAFKKAGVPFPRVAVENFLSAQALNWLVSGDPGQALFTHEGTTYDGGAPTGRLKLPGLPADLESGLRRRWADRAAELTHPQTRKKAKGTTAPDAQPEVYFNDTHKNAQPNPRGAGPNGGRRQSHHAIQQEWAKHNIPGYDEALAPTITIETGSGLPHTIINARQENRKAKRQAAGLGKWSSTIQDELGYIVGDLRAAGFDDPTIQKVLEANYKMLDRLNVSYTPVSL